MLEEGVSEEAKLVKQLSELSEPDISFNDKKRFDAVLYAQNILYLIDLYLTSDVIKRDELSNYLQSQNHRNDRLCVKSD